MLRIFCALEIPATVRDEIASYIAQLRRRNTALRIGWDKPEKLHLTLKFFGDVNDAQLQEIIAASNLVAARHKPFALQIRGCGVFPPREATRVLWLGVNDQDAAFTRLETDSAGECARRGFPREQRKFTPHLTIARIKESNPATFALAAEHLANKFAAPPFAVTHIAVIKSTLQPRGSIYQTIHRAELATEK